MASQPAYAPPAHFLHRIRWMNLAVLTVTPSLALYGLWTTSIQRPTLLFTIAYYLFSMLGITAGYHRLWSHRSYTAALPLQMFLLAGGSSAVQGSLYWWARTHRAHHRYSDTPRDPYNASEGFVHAHIGWTLLVSKTPRGRADSSDLERDTLVQFQHRWYALWALFMGYLLPAAIPGMLWGDWRGGWYIAGMARLTLAHHCTFAINSLAHTLGDAPYDATISARDHLLSAIVTLGEGYHNFHHQFPSDYRSAAHWSGFDPTKWYIRVCATLGLASHLHRFPANEVAKCAFATSAARLKQVQDSLEWPMPTETLPLWSWSRYQEESKTRILLLVAGFVHDVTAFAAEHPGGAAVLNSRSGRDVTPTFYGGAWTHSTAAQNLLAMFRIAALDGGVEHVTDTEVPQHRKKEETDDRFNPSSLSGAAVETMIVAHKVPPAQRLKLVEVM